MHALGDAVTRVQNAELQQEAAFARLKAAQTDYNKALESGNQAEIERTKSLFKRPNRPVLQLTKNT